MGLSTPEWLEKSINEGIVARFPFLWWVINLVWACVFIFIMLRVMRHLADYSTGQPPCRVCLFFPCTTALQGSARTAVLSTATI